MLTELRELREEGRKPDSHLLVRLNESSELGHVDHARLCVLPRHHRLHVTLQLCGQVADGGTCSTPAYEAVGRGQEAGGRHHTNEVGTWREREGFDSVSL